MARRKIETDDDAYKKHLRELGLDRPKDFYDGRQMTTEEYVVAWCALNGLVHKAKARTILKAEVKDTKEAVREFKRRKRLGI